MNRARSFLFLMVLALGVSGVGCPCVNSAVNNDPALRWWLFSNFGASKVCPEMLKRGVPLKLTLLGPDNIGRFFPAQCVVHVDDNARTMRLDVTGQGYVILPVTKRVGFYAGVGVEFTPDFHLGDDATYVWGRFKQIDGIPDLRLLGVENPLVSLATQTPLGNLATVLGQGVLQSQLAQGFTVVQSDDGQDFTLGILQPPAKPKRQFQSGSDRIVLESGITDLHAVSRDYLGPFAVEQSGAALYMHVSANGPVSYAVVTRDVGDAWRQPYQAAQPIAAAPAQPISYGQLSVGDQTMKFPLDPGSYYFVVENLNAPSPAVLGLSSPFEAVTQLTYSAELGER
ncbi:MAG: hypothetical protein ABI461_11540 [Polyangiaceae bacterium]